jgi:hypothetical protein
MLTGALIDHDGGPRAPPNPPEMLTGALIDHDGGAREPPKPPPSFVLVGRAAAAAGRGLVGGRDRAVEAAAWWCEAGDHPRMPRLSARVHRADARMHRADPNVHRADPNVHRADPNVHRRLSDVHRRLHGVPFSGAARPFTGRAVPDPRSASPRSQLDQEAAGSHPVRMSEDVVTRFIDSLLSAFDRDEGVADKAVLIKVARPVRLPRRGREAAGTCREA